MTDAIKRGLGAMLLIVSTAGAAAAQTGAGSIAGTVKDASGGAVPGATITVASPDKGVEQTGQSNAQGGFVFPLLPPGTYTISVELSGFKKTAKSNVILPVASRVNIGDLVLEVGNISEAVTVEANVGRLQIQTESGERSDLVTNAQLRDLALNGRNVVDLMKTIPGVIAGGTVTSSTVNNVVGGFNINGTRSLQHDYTVDGVTNLNLGNNTGALVSVNPDALEDVKVMTSNYQAEYGRSGGGVVALTTRGGTNEYHGGLRYFKRDDRLNANTFFNNARGGESAGFPRPTYRFNYYGWDFGGPVPIAKGKANHKVFFFAAQEYYDQLVPQAASVNIRVPTAAERSGDFSQTVDGTGRAIPITDPLTGLQFPGNRIPTNRVYAPGQAVLNLFPLPNSNASATYNYTSQVPSQYPRREDIARVDWQISSNTRLSGRWVHNFDDQQFAYGTTTASWNFPLTVTDRKNGPGTTLSFTLTHVISSTLVNEFIYGAGRGGVDIVPSDDKATRAVTGINTPLLFPDANAANLIPSLTFGGIASITAPVNTSVFGPFNQKFVIDNFIDNLTKSMGKHTLKAGLYYQRASNASNSQTNVQSNIDYTATGTNPLNTGYPFANALLGVYTSYTQASSKPNGKYFYYDFSGYIQDTFKPNEKTTLDLGLRLSHYDPYYNAAGPGAYFNPALYSAARAPRLYRGTCVALPCTNNNLRGIDPATAGTPTVQNTVGSFFIGKLVPNTGDLTNGMGLTSEGYMKGGINGQAILPQPRLGFAWDPTGDHRTVVRGGFGLSFDRYESGAGVGNGATNQPYVFNPTLVNGYLQDLTAGSGGALAPQAIVGVDPNAKWPAVYSYSAGVQRDLGRGVTVDIAYVGTQSRNNPRRANLNVLPYGTTFQASAQDPTRFATGTVPAVEAGLPAVYQTAGVPFTGQFALPADFLRPYQGYGDITYFYFDGRTSFNSLQASVQRRFSRGFSFGASYTLSRATTTVSDDGTFTNNGNPEAFDSGLATFDRTHYLVVNYIWNLPAGGKLLGNSALAKGLLDNWVLSGISWMTSGTPAELALTISGQDAGNRLLGTYTAGNASGQQPRFYVSGDPQSDPNAINTAAFTIPGINDRGPYPRFNLRNPGFQNHDLSLFKNFPIGSSSKRYVQFRLEMFNVFNSAQFSGVNRTTNVTNAAGQTGAAIFNNFTGLTVTNNTRPAGNTSVLGSFFGEYTGTRDPRIIQLGLKLYF